MLFNRALSLSLSLPLGSIHAERTRRNSTPISNPASSPRCSRQPDTLFPTSRIILASKTWKSLSIHLFFARANNSSQQLCIILIRYAKKENLFLRNGILSKSSTNKYRRAKWSSSRARRVERRRLRKGREEARSASVKFGRREDYQSFLPDRREQRLDSVPLKGSRKKLRFQVRDNGSGIYHSPGQVRRREKERDREYVTSA